jgi:hypothetical protein
VIDFNCMFMGCSTLNQSFRSWNLESARLVHSMFAGCNHQHGELGTSVTRILDCHGGNYLFGVRGPIPPCYQRWNDTERKVILDRVDRLRKKVELPKTKVGEGSFSNDWEQYIQLFNQTQILRETRRIEFLLDRRQFFPTTNVTISRF